MSAYTRILPVCFALCALCLFASCTPRQLGATSQGFYGSGTTGFAVAVSPPLQLVAAGNTGAAVPSDINIKPRGSFVYGMFADPAAIRDAKSVSSHAHIVYSELPRYRWEWEMETWAKKEAFSYEKNKNGGKYWTIQTFPLAAAGDWFSELYSANGVEPPAFWLAKRWSSTTNEYMRLVAEYREPAPQCMREQLEAGVDERGNLEILTRSVVAECAKELGEFNKRADRAVNPGGLAETAAGAAEERFGAVPATLPRMDKLVGRAQHVERDSYNYRD